MVQTDLTPQGLVSYINIDYMITSCLITSQLHFAGFHWLTFGNKFSHVKQPECSKNLFELIFDMLFLILQIKFKFNLLIQFDFVLNTEVYCVGSLLLFTLCLYGIASI